MWRIDITHEEIFYESIYETIWSWPGICCCLSRLFLVFYLVSKHCVSYSTDNINERVTWQPLQLFDTMSSQNCSFNTGHVSIVLIPYCFFHFFACQLCDMFCPVLVLLDETLQYLVVNFSSHWRHVILLKRI